MNEQQYLNELMQHLKKLNEKERADIRRDFEEYFENGRQEGKSTTDIITALGSADTIAKDLLTAYSEEEFVSEIVIHPTQKDVPYSNILIKAKSVHLTICPTDRSEAYVEVKNDEEQKTKTTLSIENDTLKVVVEKPDAIRKFWFITIVGDITKSEAVLYIPKKRYDEIEAKNANGKLTFDEIETNRLEADSMNGRVVLQHVSATVVKATSMNGRVIIEDCNITSGVATSMNGRVICSNTTSSELKLSSANGRVVLEEVTGGIHAKSSNGTIDATLSKVTNDSKFATSNGSIKVKSKLPLENVNIVAKLANGKPSIYGEKTNKLVAAENDPTLTLSNSNGSIKVMILEEE